MRKTAALIWIGLTLMYGWLIISFTTYISKEDLTKSRMRIVERVIRKFYHEKGTMPASLEEVKNAQRNVDGFAVNAWGGPISYHVTNETEVTLKTYGSGGSNAQIRQEFIYSFTVESALEVGKDNKSTVSSSPKIKNGLQRERRK